MSGRDDPGLPPPALSVRGVQQFYGGSHILRDVSFEARAGEVTVILGRNGVGKTTLLKSIMGVVPIRAGEIALDGARIERLPPHERARRGLAYVPQGREIFPRLTVRENLATGLAHRPASTPLPAELLELFPVLGEMLARRGGDLSGGQQQQLAIARALAPGPRVLLLDEPTEGIQPNVIQAIGRAIRRLAARGDLAIVLVEQYFDFAAELADRWIRLERGAVVDAGDAARLRTDEVRRATGI